MRDPEFFLKKYEPVTSSMSFIDIDFEKCAQEIFEHNYRVNKEWEFPWEVQKIHVPDNLVDKLYKMLPLAPTNLTKELISKTTSNWVMYTTNGNSGSMSCSEASYVAERFKARVVTVLMVEDIRGGPPGSVQFSVKDYSKSRDTFRIVSAHKESRWEWTDYGELFSWEEVEKYKEKKIKDRLTPEMLERYCKHLGIDLFNPDFYAGDAYIIESYTLPNSICLDKYPNQ